MRLLRQRSARDADHEHVAFDQYMNEVAMAIERPASGFGDEANTQPASTALRHRLRLRLERHLGAESFQPAMTVIGFRGTDIDVLRRGIDRPEDAILGFLLPAEYSAVGVVASSVIATPPTQRHEDAALAIAVSRSASVVSMLATARKGVIDTKAPQGWLIDACRRSVGLATDPCDTAALVFPVALWLDRLMVQIVNAASTEPLTWQQAVTVCPIPSRWRTSDAADLGTTLGSTTMSWKALRNASIQGLRSPVGVSPERARWMDDAMFARWLLGSFPDLASLRADVEFLAPPPVAERIEIALRSAWLAFAD